MCPVYGRIYTAVCLCQNERWRIFLNESFVHAMAVVTADLTVYEPHSNNSKCTARIC